MTTQRVVDAATVSDFERLTAAGVAVCHFWAPWCEPCKPMDAVLAHLSAAHAQAAFVRVEAEALSDVSEKHGVPSVPFFLFFKGGAVVDRLEGADAAALSAKTAALCGAARAPPPPAAAQPDITTRLAALVHSAPVMLFMKGSPGEPKCGFSRKVVEALGGAGCSSFGHFDILGDAAVREGLKTYSNWPTYPQLYVSGELVGGCDIVLEMAANGELKTTIDKAAAAPVPAVDEVDARIRKLLASAPVMLFMKGSPTEPKCGFSRKVVEAIRATEVPFSSFDILGDEAIRSGLKTFSNWPTYPQLYARGELVGGCDIVLEMASSGELKATLAPPA